jgi:biotin-dependent carboxylase-like uncharacterized protein
MSELASESSILTAVLERAATPPVTRSTLCVRTGGMATTVQDLGRTGFAHLGVSPSGPADVHGFTLANRLVGNPEGAAALEVTLGGLEFALSTDRYVAVTGAPVPVTLDGVLAVEPTRLYVRAGSVVRLGRPAGGLRTYLAVAGGLAVPGVLGSASRDTLSGLGPAPVRDGAVLDLGEPGVAPDLPIELAFSRVPYGSAVVGIRWGPRDALFDAADRALLLRTDWQVTDRLDRVGVRLCGRPLGIGAVHLPSEGMVRGAIQIPPSGEPIVFLADHPATGGYPVIAVVTESDLGLVAQATPGTRIRFIPVGRRERYR